MAQFDEGLKLEFNPLLSLDGKVVDAVVRCEVDLVEKLIPVMIDVPTTVAPRQRQRIDIPQPISSRLHERFRWPADQVLLISLGVGPAPVAPATSRRPCSPGRLRPTTFETAIERTTAWRGMIRLRPPKSPSLVRGLQEH